jgi:3-methyladenine DNA glycosylase AlkD
VKRQSGVTIEKVIRSLKELSVPEARLGMQRFGISTDHALGVSIPNLRKLAKAIGVDHRLAQQLWKTEIHEARILASMVDDPAKVTDRQMEKWVKSINSWDLCDQCCSNLFDKTANAHKKAAEWSRRDEEFVKRAGFAMMATLAVHDKEARDSTFVKFYPAIKRGATDERNFVKKAVNWALRQIGKRNKRLNGSAIKVAKELAQIDSRGARWIAADALRELQSEAVQRRLKA